MEAATRNSLINTALTLAFDATGLVPGLAEAHGALQLAMDAAPALESAVAYFQSDEGKRAINHLNDVFAALRGGMAHDAVFATPAKIEAKYPGMCWAWVGGLDGLKWMPRKQADEEGLQIVG
jgi:hypothetical protein